MFWPWWLGGLALGLVAAGHCYLLGKTLGVSGILNRVIHWRETLETETAEKAVEDEAGFQDALIAATMAEFADQLSEEDLAALAATEKPKAEDNKSLQKSTSLKESIAFLLAVIPGAFLASVVNGRFQVTYSMAPTYHHFFGTGFSSWLTLAFGGFLVGFGVMMAGGCTSGHGLSGCGRAQPGSFVATACFFGMAVGMSFLLTEWR